MRVYFGSWFKQGVLRGRRVGLLPAVWRIRKQRKSNARLSFLSLSLIIYSGTPTLGVVPPTVRVSVLSSELSGNSWPQRNVQRRVT